MTNGAERTGPARLLPTGLRGLLACCAVLFVAGSGLLSVSLIYYTLRFPDPMTLRKSEPGPVVRVLARDGAVLLERGAQHQFVPLDLLPRHVIDAVVATEDRRFFDHNGLDPVGLLRAVFANIRAGRYVQGGSTLSQQLAKNLFLSSDRTLGRKLEELLLAIWLEVRLPKQDILELYLNRVYFGGGAYGIEAAARRYFDKPASTLTLAEGAVLAGLLKAPSKYSPLSSPGLARARSRVVLKKMVAAGFIGEAAEGAAARQSVRFIEPSGEREPTGVEYAVEFVLDRLPPLVGTGHREIVVETTIDGALQRRAQAAVEAVLGNEGVAAGAGQAAAIVIDGDGGIRALVGGRSWAKSQFNRAVKARRQPGSAFKPFVYLAAIEQGATPDTTVLDMPLNIGGWSPRNEGGQHRGTMPLRQALAHSVNTVAVRLQQDVGVQRVIATARRLGIKSELRPDPSLALGTSEVSLMELSGAYAVLASGGLGIEPHAIKAVRSGGNTILYKRRDERPRMMVAPDHVGSMSSMLNTAMTSGTGRRAALPRHVAAGKTGTTQDFRDAWFVGYTAHLTGGVWVGNDGGEPMSRVMGGGLPAVIWRTIMQSAHERLPPSTLPGMLLDDPPWTSDTLRDSDRIARPVETISDLIEIEGTPKATAKAATVGAVRPAHRAPRSRSTLVEQAKVIERSAPPRGSLQGPRPAEAGIARRSLVELPPEPARRENRQPFAPIDPDLFQRAAQSLEPARQIAEPVAPAPEVERLLRPVQPKARPGLMGLGAKPPEPSEASD